MSKSRKETRAVGLWFGLCIAVILCIICPSSVAATSATDLLFQQTNWLAPDDTVLEADSRWGSMTFSYDPDPSTTQYLNLALANSADGPRVWAVQNLPLPYVDNGVFAARRETVHVNLADLGYNVGDNWDQTHFTVSVNSTISTSVPSGTLSPSSVFDLNYNSWESTSTFGTGFSAGTPTTIAITEPSGTRVHARHDLRTLEEGKLKCMAGAFARSLDWLNRKHNLGLPGITSIYDGLIAEGVSDPGSFSFAWTDHAKWINAKQSYLTKKAPGRVNTKIIDLTGMVAETPGTPQQEGGDLWAWLRQEWQHGEDIEIAYKQYNEEGEFVARHIGAIVDLEFGPDGNPTILRTEDDVRQGEPGGVSTLTGKLMRNWNGSGYDYCIGGYEWKIEYAVSESVPEPSALLTLLLGLSGFVGTAFRRRR